MPAKRRSSKANERSSWVKVKGQKHNGAFGTLGPIVPTFRTAFCQRSYCLQVRLTIDCGEVRRVLAFMTGEIILLPDKLSFGVDKQHTAEIGPSKEIERFEIAHRDLVEMASASSIQELNGYREPGELLGLPAELKS